MTYAIDILKYIGPFVGIFIGWFLSQRNETARIKYTETRQLKRSLFVLLEVRNQITIEGRFNKYTSLFLEKINLKIKDISDEEIDENQYKDYFNSLIKTLLGDMPKDTYKQFNTCIDNLSEIDPLLAYRINGKQNLNNYINSFEDNTSSIKNIENIEIETVTALFKPQMIDDVKRELESIIISIAALISKKYIVKAKEIMTEAEDSEIDANLELIVDNVFETIKNEC